MLPICQSLSASSSSSRGSSSTTATSNVAATSSQEAHITLPLPLELREMIYSYLVAIKHDCLDDGWSQHPSRELRTNICRVNKTIREEALGYLYRTHTFVRFDFDLRNYKELVVASSLPVVRPGDMPPGFDAQVLSIAAQTKALHHHPLFNPRPTTDTGSVFLLTQDLPALCELLRLVALQTRMCFNCIDTPKGVISRPRRVCYSGDVLNLRVRLQPKSNARLHEHEQARLLRELSTINGGIVATFEAFAAKESLGMDSAVIAREMRPSLVWLRAWDWDRLHWRMQWKARADALITAPSRKKLHLASTVLHQLDATQPPIHKLRPPPGPVISDDPDLSLVYQHHLTFEMDCRLTRVQLLMACDYIEAADDLLWAMEYMMKHMSGLLWLHLLRVSLSLSLIHFIRHRGRRGRLLKGLLRTAQVCCESCHNRHLKHDIAQAKEVLAFARAESREALKVHPFDLASSNAYADCIP